MHRSLKFSDIGVATLGVLCELNDLEMAEEVEEPPTVLVTGASGYIATHLIKSLLEEGLYKVRGTVRDLKATEKIQPIKDLEPEYVKYPLELVEATLSEKECWVEAVRGCTYVYHIASPIFGSGTDLTPEEQQEKIIKPAVEGTLTILQACAEVGGVKRVVLTSSMAAISCGLRGDPKKPKDYCYTEEDWSDEEACTPYDVSKKKAEEAAWDFVRKLEDDKKFELTVVNPAYIQGPLLSSASGSVSQQICENLLSGKVPAIPDINLVIVDVRDVVAVHRAAMEKPEAAGERFLTAAESISFKEWASIIKEEFQDQGYSVSLMPMPKFGLWVLKFFSQTAKNMYDMWGLKVLFSNDKIRSLGVCPRPVKETLIEMCYSLIELGVVAKKPRYRQFSRAASGAEGEDGPRVKSCDKPIESSVDKPAESAETRPAESTETQEQSQEQLEETTESSEDKPAETAEDKPAETAEDKPAESAEDKPAESSEPQEQSEKQAENEQPESQETPAETQEEESVEKPAEPV